MTDKEDIRNTEDSWIFRSNYIDVNSMTVLNVRGSLGNANTVLDSKKGKSCHSSSSGREGVPFVYKNG